MFKIMHRYLDSFIKHGIIFCNNIISKLIKRQLENTNFVHSYNSKYSFTKLIDHFFSELFQKKIRFSTQDLSKTWKKNLKDQRIGRCTAARSDATASKDHPIRNAISTSHQIQITMERVTTVSGRDIVNPQRPIFADSYNLSPLPLANNPDLIRGSDHIVAYQSSYSRIISECYIL